MSEGKERTAQCQVPHLGITALIIVPLENELSIPVISNMDIKDVISRNSHTMPLVSNIHSDITFVQYAAHHTVVYCDIYVSDPLTLSL